MKASQIRLAAEDRKLSVQEIMRIHLPVVMPLYLQRGTAGFKVTCARCNLISVRFTRGDANFDAIDHVQKVIRLWRAW